VTPATPEQQARIDALRALLPMPVIDFVGFCTALKIAARVGDPVVIDLEWGTSVPEPGMVTIGVGNPSFVAQYTLRGTDLEADEVRAAVMGLIITVPVIYHNAEADIREMRRLLLLPVTRAMHHDLRDTMLAHAVLESELPHDLEYLALEHGTLPSYKGLRTVEGAGSVYNAADLIETYYLWTRYIAPYLERDPQARAVYETESLPFIDLQIESVEAGIAVHPTEPMRLWRVYGEKRERAQTLADAYAGYPMSLASPDQLKHYLYNVEGLPIQRKRAGRGEQGPATTDKDALAALRRREGTEWDEADEPTLASALAAVDDGGHPVLEARYLFYGAQQARGHYVAPCLVENDSDEAPPLGVRDRIYPELRLHTQATGRHSYVSPALSQFKGPVAGMLVSDPGTCWIGHDWSNIETWLLGALAGDAAIMEAKAHGWDTHTVNFCDATGIDRPPILTKALHTAPECAAWRAAVDWRGGDDLRRTFFKRYIYRLHYRGKPENAGDIPGARALGFDIRRLVATSSAYLAKHPAIPEFWRALDAQIEATGLVRTFMGRPRRLTSRDMNARKREGSNHPLQGGTADIYATTALAVKAAAPYARLVYGSFDSMWWSVPVERRLEFTVAYAPLVERPFSIRALGATSAVPVSFPASFKALEALA
jgi:hypothetical protein